MSDPTLAPLLPPAVSAPWIIGHRGAPAHLPENTLAGFTHAFDAGADAVELDVHATRDGVVVVHHDDRLADGRRIADHAWAELRPATPGADPIPSLEEVLAAVEGRGAVFVEIKGRAIEAEVVRVIQRSAARCAVHAFDHRSALAVRRLAPELPTGVLLSSYVVDVVAVLRAARSRTLWQHWSQIDEPLVRAVRSIGGVVVAWTVNDVAVARDLLALGVSGLCSDDPGRMRASLGLGGGSPAAG